MDHNDTGRWQDHEDDMPPDNDDEPECPRCHGDGRDPMCDYLMPCPMCQGEQTP